MASDATFARAIKMTLAFEGGYVCDPADPGGATKYGISQRAYPDLDIASLTVADAEAIYKRDYWPHWSALPDAIAAKMFDLGINMGNHGATCVLQRALIALGKPMTVDGELGPVTRGAVTAVDPATLLTEIILEACYHYKAIVKSRPEDMKFLAGWLRRAQAIPVPA